MIIVDFVSACICIRIVISRLYNIFIFVAWGQACHYGMVSSLNRRSKKRPKRESETEYNTSKASRTREENLEEKRKKKTKKKLHHAGRKEEEKKKRTDEQRRRRKEKRKKNTLETVSKLPIRIIFSLLS